MPAIIPSYPFWSFQFWVTVPNFSKTFCLNFGSYSKFLRQKRISFWKSSFLSQSLSMSCFVVNLSLFLSLWVSLSPLVRTHVIWRRHASLWDILRMKQNLAFLWSKERISQTLILIQILRWFFNFIFLNLFVTSEAAVTFAIFIKINQFKKIYFQKLVECSNWSGYPLKVFWTT